ncbi:MAG: hypothetical protein ACK4TA_12335 [Saprospiraceae bacterium]
MKDQFYIGWQDQAPAPIAQKIGRTVVSLLLLIVAVAALLVLSQQPFATSTYEIAQVRTLEGILLREPIPCLKMPVGVDQQGVPRFQRVVLIGFGKKGATPTLDAIEKAQQQSLQGKAVKLQGKLIYYDSQLAFELVQGAAAFQGFGSVQDAPSFQQTLGEATLRGEILDPKCYLGVMRPGEGKPHRSCAIRCIEGGIPPFFKVATKDDARQYFLVLDAQGQPLREKISKYVADQVQLCGTVEQWDNWYVLKTDMTQGFQLLMPHWAKGQDIPMCYSK